MKKLVKNPEVLSDDRNPEYIFTLTDTGLLLDIAAGKIDVQELVRKELAGRGVNDAGAWIGFDNAFKFWGLPVPQRFVYNRILGFRNRR